MPETADPPTDPLAPIEFVVTCLGALVLLAFVATVPLAVLGSGSILGFGEPEACVVVDRDAVPFGGADGPGGFFVAGMRPHGDFFPQSVQLCDKQPGIGVRAAVGAGRAADLLVLVGFLLLTRLLVRSARRRGLFSPEVAARTRSLGWFLVLGGLGAAVLQDVALATVVDAVVDDVGWTDELIRLDLPWTLLIAGAGVITFSRMLRHAVELQDEVDATI